MTQRNIHSPNSEYERNVVLEDYLFNNKTLTDEEILILQTCSTRDWKAIALIGCLLREDDFLNHIRLLIGSQLKYEKKIQARSIFLLEEINLEALDKKAFDLWLRQGKNELNEVEQAILDEYNINFGKK